MHTYKCFEDAYRSILTELRENGNAVPSVRDPTSVGCDFGTRPRNTVEIAAFGFRLHSPRARVLTNSARRFDVGFAVASFLWTLRGAEDLPSIAFYNQRGERFSDDGRNLSGAFGKRIFGDLGETNQFLAALTRLRNDPTTRRAVLQIYTPFDTANASRDTPCCLSVQYLIRSGALHAITLMRSQSALMVLPYDVFLFTMLQEVAALELGVAVGSYHHFATSMHLYDDEISLADECIMSPGGESQPMPLMTMSPLQDRRIFDAESEIRNSLQRNPDCRIDMDQFQLDPYWTHLMTHLTRRGKLTVSRARD